MAFTLDKTQDKQHAELIDKLVGAHARLTEATKQANDAIADAVEAYNAEVQRYNETLHEINEFVSTVAAGWRAEYDEKSEKWQESDRASDVDSMINDWEGFSADDVDEASIDDIELPDSVVEELDGLPKEC